MLFEAPGRVAATLRDLAERRAVQTRPGAVCRELTKLHETIDRGSLGILAESARDGSIPARGEFVIVVGAADSAAERADDGDVAVERLVAARAEVARLVAAGSGRSEAARAVAAATGLTRRELYRLEE